MTAQGDHHAVFRTLHSAPCTAHPAQRTLHSALSKAVHTLLLLSLCLLLPLLLSTFAQAQSSGGWVFDHYAQSPSGTGTGYEGETQSPPWQANQNSYEWNVLSGSITDTITAYFRWTGAPGQAVTPLTALVTGNAQADTGPGSSINVSDGLNDPAVPVYEGPWPQGFIGEDSSTGGHLEQVTAPAGSGPGTLLALNPVTLSASCYSTGGGAVMVTLTAVVDNRSVTITGIGQTYHKGYDANHNPIPVLNVPDSDGTGHADTVINSDNTNGPLGYPQDNTYTYDASCPNWAPNSTTYYWYSSLTGQSDNGTVLPVQPFSVSVGYNQGVEQTDHINLSVYGNDQGQQVKGSGNYYITFHAPWEPLSWPSSSTYKVGTAPDPNNPSWPTYPWQSDAQYNLIGPSGTSMGVTITEPGIKDIEVGLDLPIDVATAHFGITIQPQPEMTVTRTEAPSPALNPGQMTWLVWRDNVTRTIGYLDQYTASGYTGQGLWGQDQAVGIDLDLYSPYQPTNTVITNPPANWNPPGYTP